MTGLAVKKKGHEKLIKCGHSKRKIFIKTSPTGIPHQMYSVEDIRIFENSFFNSFTFKFTGENGSKLTRLLDNLQTGQMFV